MTSWLFLCLLFVSQPAAEPLPAVALLPLEVGDAGALERVRTMLQLHPGLRLVPPGELPDGRLAALRSTLQAVGEYPDPLVRAVLEKHRHQLRLDRWVVLTTRGLFVQGPRDVFAGPFPVPGPRGQLAEGLLLLLQRPDPVRSRPVSGTLSPPFYRNWLFWTGVGVIVGGLTAMSLLSQDPTDVEIHVFHR